jgi:hypothetical protein
MAAMIVAGCSAFRRAVSTASSSAAIGSQCHGADRRAAFVMGDAPVLATVEGSERGCNEGGFPLDD